MPRTLALALRGLAFASLASCLTGAMGCGHGTRSLLPPRNYYLYAANRDDSSVSAYSLDTSSGTLTAVKGSPFALGTGNAPTGLAATPSGAFLFVADTGSNQVSELAVDAATGALAAVSGSPVSVGSTPVALQVDPQGKFLYVANSGSSSISAFSINSNTGALTAISQSPFAAGTSPVALAVDPNSRFLYSANSLSANLSGYSIDSTSGSLASLGSAGFPMLATQNGDQPDALALAGSGKFLIVADNANRILVYSLNSATGALSLVASQLNSTQSGLIDVNADPTGAWVYVTSNSVPAKIFGFAIDTTKGTLTPITQSPTAITSPTRTAIDPTGTFLYAATSGGIAGFRISSSTGALTALSTSPFTAGNGPAALAIVSVPKP